MLRCSFKNAGDFNLSASRIQVRKLVGKENEYQITFRPDCDACGVCAVYCPYDALSRVKIKEKV
jgi:ferredoxin